MNSVEAFDLLATTVLLLNQSGEVAEANAAAEVMFGRSRRTLIGLPAAHLFERDSALEQSFRQACAGDVDDCRQFARTRRGTDSVEVGITSIALNGRPWAALIEVKDIEQRVLVDHVVIIARQAARGIVAFQTDERGNVLAIKVEHVEGGDPLLEHEVAAVHEGDQRDRCRRPVPAPDVQGSDGRIRQR